MELPVSLEDLNPEEAAEREARGFRRYNVNMVRTNPGKVLLSQRYRRLASTYYNFQFRNDDVVLVSFPKTGTVWTMEILQALLDPDNITQTKHKEGTFSFCSDLMNDIRPGDPSVEKLNQLCPGALPEDGIQLQLAAAYSGRRILAFHVPLDLLHPQLLHTCKVVYVTRNPKDVCVSSYHFFSLVKAFEGKLSDYAEYFMEDGLMFGPFWDHAFQAWHKRNHPNLYFMFFEDLKADTLGQVRKLNDFLQLHRSDEQLMSVVECTSFRKLKAKYDQDKPKVYGNDGSFFRKGEVGNWKNAFTSDLQERMNTWIKEKSQETGISFKYE